MSISANPKPTIYRNLYENTGPGDTITTADEAPNMKFDPLVLKGRLCNFAKWHKQTFNTKVTTL